MYAKLAHRLASACVVTAGIVCSTPSVHAQENDRLFGVLPNYSTVDGQPADDGSQTAPAISTRLSFRLASLSSFDPVVFPYVGLMTAISADRGANYGDRYMRAFADNSIGNFMTTAVVPTLTNQDPRYFRSGEGGIFRRMAYAASRSAITRTRAGHAAFNISEIGGNLAGAGIANLYHDPIDRTVGATMSRWGLQVMGDTVANELKEFWPDIHARLRRSR
jgi:hypothetical protein